MTGSFNPGDVNVAVLNITSPRGYLELVHSFVSSNVYESIFTPGIVCAVNVLDTDDFIGEMQIVGDEIINFAFGAPGGTVATYAFSLDKITDNVAMGLLKSKVYTLHGVSTEAMQAKTNYVQKSYNKTISDIIQDIHTNFLMSSKPLNIEQTQGMQNIVIPNKKPYAAIDMVRRRAMSALNQSSTFLYFENALGFNFVTMEGLFKGSPVKQYKQVDTVGWKLSIDADNNILAYELPKQAGSTERIGMGGLMQRTATFDFRTRKYNYTDQTMSESGTFGASGNYNSATFKGQYGQKPGRFNFIPVDTAQRQNTFIPQNLPFLQAYISNIVQNYIKIRVPGDAAVCAGNVIYCILPAKVSTTGNVPTDPLINGNFLVSRINRYIGTAGERPRYTDIIEGLSGKLATGV